MGIEKRRTSAANAGGVLNGGRSPPAPRLTRRPRISNDTSTSRFAKLSAGNGSTTAASANNSSHNSSSSNNPFAQIVRVGLLLLMSIWAIAFLAMFITIKPPASPQQKYSVSIDTTTARERVNEVEQVAERKFANALTQAEQWEARMLERGMEIEQNVANAAKELEEKAVDAVRGRLRRDLAGPPKRRRNPSKRRKGLRGQSDHAAPSQKRAAGAKASPTDGVWEHNDGYHYRAERAALAPVRTPIKVTTATTKIASDTTTNAINNDYIDMRDLTATLPFDNPDGGAWKQGWDVQPTPLDPANPLQVYVLPHAHCDPGWIKTFDEYFRSQTSGILTSVYKALRKDGRRKFIWAEISYFEWWWREQDASTQSKMRELISNGQFEFVTGGWVQPDEANTQRYAIEVQLQEGHDWLRSTFGEGVLPKYGWSIDPFGYSPTMADVLKDYGFEGMLIQRVHYAVKKELAKRTSLEFNWRQTYDETGRQDIFTHVMPFYSYDVPHTCGPDPSVVSVRETNWARKDRK